MGVCVLKDSLIKSPKDLEGRKMASTVSSGDYPFLGVFAKRANFDISKVNRLQTDPNVRQRLLVGKEVDAISGFASSFAPIFAAEKVEVRNMLYSDVGLTLYNNSLITQQATLEKEPQLCADITDGLLEALKFSLLSPEIGSAFPEAGSGNGALGHRPAERAHWREPGEPVDASQAGQG